MHINATLILGRWIDEMVGEAQHPRNLVPGLRVEVCIAATSVDSTMSDPDIGETGGIIGSDRYITKYIGHVVVDTAVPAQRGERVNISKSPYYVADAIGTCEWECSERGRQRS